MERRIEDTCGDRGCMAVHSSWDTGFWSSLPGIWNVEFVEHAIPYERELLPILYQQASDRRLPVDFVCFGTLIVPLKALQNFQALRRLNSSTFLKASRFSKALLQFR